MKKYVLSAITIIMIVLSACNGTAKKEDSNDIKNDIEAKGETTPKHDKNHWGYVGETGPDHWAEIENSECGGKFQSPINILKTVKDTSLVPLDIHYHENTKINNIVNNGHSIQFNFEPGDYINLDGKKYALKQFHFHESSEHTIKGIRYPLVIHMVNVSEDGKYAVIAVLARESDEDSDPFEFLDKYLPIQVDETKEVNREFEMDDVLPDNKAYYTYEGSLTTPPCTEGVKWFVIKEPIEVTKKLVDELTELMPLNNYRGTQPLNNRVVKESN